jgi:hypothetical protein
MLNAKILDANGKNTLKFEMPIFTEKLMFRYPRINLLTE